MLVDTFTRPIRYRQLRNEWHQWGAIPSEGRSNVAAYAAAGAGAAAMLALTWFAGDLVSSAGHLSSAGHHVTGHQARIVLAEVTALVIAGCFLLWIAFIAMARLMRSPVTYRTDHVAPASVTPGDWLEVNDLDWDYNTPPADRRRRLLRVVDVQASEPLTFLALSDGSVLQRRADQRLRRVTDIEPSDKWALATICSDRGNATYLPFTLNPA